MCAYYLLYVGHCVCVGIRGQPAVVSSLAAMWMPGIKAQSSGLVGSDLTC